MRQPKIIESLLCWKNLVTVQPLLCMKDPWELPLILGRTWVQALYELHLDNNALSGPLPASWGAPPNWRTLGWLDLHGNQLTGSVPSTWTPLTAMHKLHAL
jgi:hypothetical protein